MDLVLLLVQGLNGLQLGVMLFLLGVVLALPLTSAIGITVEKVALRTGKDG